jgi:TRAP-type C4-dicarboxylate transport system permease small subunit
MVKRVLDGASNLLAFFAGAAVILIVSTYYIVAIVFLPFALVERSNGNIVVELLAQHLPRRVSELLIACVALISAVYFTAFAIRTGEDAIQKYNVGEVILGNSQLTVWPTRFYLPIGCGLLVLVLLYKAFRLFKGDNSVLDHPEGN